MLTVKRNKISLTRGDTASLKLILKNEKGEIYKLNGGESIVFTLKKSPNSDVVIIQKKLENNEFRINSSDTHNLEYGPYVYDIQLTNDNNLVNTVVPPTIFEILPEVNWDG